MAEEYCACERDGGRENESKCAHELDQSKMSIDNPTSHKQGNGVLYCLHN